MQFLYNISIHLYHFAIWIASFFNKKAKLWIDGRRDVFSNLKSQISNLKSELVWFHCASLGEFEQGREVIEKFKVQSSKFKVVLTFFSPSGYEVRKNYSGADHIFYLPIDTPANAKKFIAIVKPKAVFFIKYEFWFNYLSELKKNNIPTYLVSGIFREKHHFFKWYGSFFRNKLSCYTHFFVQDKNSERLLNNIGLKNVTISGDTRFDRVYNVSQNVKPNKLLEIFKQDKKLIVAGSTWLEDEKLLQSYKLQVASCKLVIAPHETGVEHIDIILSLFKNSKTILYSKANENNIADADVLIIDNVGMLSSLYQYASVSFIGGGFGGGIHNILEAAAFGSPVVFGPNYQNFNEAKDLIELKGAFSISNSQELESRFNSLLSDEKLLQQTSAVCKNYILNKKGATEMILSRIGI